MPPSGSHIIIPGVPVPPPRVQPELLICLSSRYHRITYYYRNPLHLCRTDQPRTKQISLSDSLISKHVIHTHNLDKVTFNYEIYLTAKLTYQQTLSRKLTTVIGLDEHWTTRTPKRTKVVRRLTGDIMATTNVSWDNVLAVMPHKVINKISDKPTYSAMQTWFKQICTNLIAVKTPQEWVRGQVHLCMLQAPAFFHARNGDF